MRREGRSYFGDEATGLVFFDDCNRTILEYCHEDWDDPGFSGEYEIDPDAQMSFDGLNKSMREIVNDLFSKLKSDGYIVSGFKWEGNVFYDKIKIVKGISHDTHWLPKTPMPYMIAC